MDYPTAWVLSRDGRLVTQVTNDIKQNLGWSVSDKSFANDGKLPSQPDSLDWLIVDLRDEDLWGCLAQLHTDATNTPGKQCQVVGVVDEGYPLDRAVLADQLLHRSISWPLSGDELCAHLSQGNGHGTSTDVVIGRQCECRTLEANNRKFLTYTPQLFRMIDDLEVAAQHDLTIMFVGETGTGKTTLGKLVHEMSSRSEQPFINVPCGALPKDLIDSELFGHVKGAFTGADRAKDR